MPASADHGAVVGDEEAGCAGRPTISAAASGPATNAALVSTSAAAADPATTVTAVRPPPAGSPGRGSRRW